MPYEKKDEYWESHQTQYGKRDRMSQGSVADRGGYNDMPAYTQENMGGKKKKNIGGYGFGKKSHNPGSHGKGY